MRCVPALCTAFVAAASTSAYAQLTVPSVLSATDSVTQPIHVFDITSGAYNASPITFGQKVTGMAYDQATRRNYVLVRNSATSTRSDLYSIDLNPLGSATFIA